MSTVEELCRSGVLAVFPITVRRHEHVERQLYLTPHCISGLQILKNLPPQPEGVVSEFMEVVTRSRQFVLGNTFYFREQLGDVACHVDYIWEIKTKFYRVFGGFTRLDCFIAHHVVPKSELRTSADYHRAAQVCIDYFDSMGLTHNHFVKGNEPRHVLSNIRT